MAETEIDGVSKAGAAGVVRLREALRLDRWRYYAPIGLGYGILRRDESPDANRFALYRDTEEIGEILILAYGHSMEAMRRAFAQWYPQSAAISSDSAVDRLTDHENRLLALEGKFAAIRSIA